MQINTTNLEHIKSQAVILYIFEDAKDKSDAFTYFDNMTNGLLTKQIYEYKAFEPTLHNSFKFSVNPSLSNKSFVHKSAAFK